MQDEEFVSSVFAFIRSGRRDTWLHYPDMQVYVRHGNRMIGDDILPMLDVANAEVAEGARGQGMFGHWLSAAENTARTLDLKGVFGESIITDRFARFFQRRGYRQEIRPGLRSTNYYRIF